MAAESKEAVAVIVLGMAGSGKTTLMQRLISHLNENSTKCYSINLDPAVGPLPYGVNIDIRDTVNYKEVMKQYSLGPNGGILTSLNLFATRIDQVLGIVEKRASTVEYILLDTPGQIEVFTWSSSGSIITEALASSVPTVVVFVVDTPRTINPSTFMSNMLCACSILYKTRLPFLLVFNKIDVQSHEHVETWMRDYDAFQAAFTQDESYAGTLARSMALVLEEFYSNIPVAAVSALSGEGIEDMFQKIDEAKAEFLRDYRPEREKRRAEMEKRQAEKMSNEQLEKKLRGTRGRDVAAGGGFATFLGPHPESDSELLDSETRFDEDEGDSSDSGDDDDGSSRESFLERERQQVEMMQLHRELAEIPAMNPQHPRELREKDMEQLRKQVAESRVDDSMDILD